MIIIKNDSNTCVDINWINLIKVITYQNTYHRRFTSEINFSDIQTSVHIKDDHFSLIHSYKLLEIVARSRNFCVFRWIDEYAGCPEGRVIQKVYTLRRFVWPNFPRHRYSVAVNAAELLRFLTTAFASVDIYDCESGNSHSKMYLYRKHDG